MRKELGLKRREREVEGGNIKKKKRIRACNVALCLLHCLLYKFYQAVSTPPQLLQSWGQLCPGRGRCDENASLPLIHFFNLNLRNRTPLMSSISTTVNLLVV